MPESAVLTVRRASDRGHADLGWLDTHYTFSFADYHDPRWMGFRTLRVVNDDVVQAGAGFPMHAHRDMEILTYVLDGALAHRDSMGNGSIIRPGEVQRMSAGTGVTHSEFNASKTDPLHLLQIWILPEVTGITPGYEQKLFAEDGRRGTLRLVASRDGGEGSLTIRQDADMYATLLGAGEEARHTLRPGRAAWVHIARGGAIVNGVDLVAGDGAAIADEHGITMTAKESSEILLFDLL